MVPARLPERRRHDPRRIGFRSRIESINSVFEPWVDVDADIAGINAGLAARVGDEWTINGRTYLIEANGHAIPRSGPGIRVLSRTAFRALQVYNEHGLTAMAEFVLDRNGVRATDREEGRDLWRMVHAPGR